MKLSLLIPIFNEEDNIALLYGKITEVLDKLEHDYEMVFVNDGSTDASKNRLDDLADDDIRVKVIHFRRNFGQTAAMMAGIDYATGDVLIPIDGDLQNDPADIPKLLEKLDEGYDVCSGWRRYRQDNPLIRNFPSHCANWLISKISGVALHDIGCSLKAYKKDVIKGIKLYGEMHRFVPIYATWQGAKVTEVEVSHHPRKYGTSKYGLERVVKVILDLMVVTFMERFAQKPIYVFGGFGLLNLCMSFVTFSMMLVYKFAWGVSFIKTPLPLVTVLFFLMGFISIFIGFIAEILMRTYYESQDKSVYLVGKCRNITEDNI